MVNIRRYQKIVSLFLVILAVILFIRDFRNPQQSLIWSKNQTINPTPTNDDKANVKFDFYTILPKQEVASSPQKAVSTSGSFDLQLGASRELKEAEQLQTQWQKMGYPVFIQKFQTDSQTVWYRVLLGPFPNADVAQQIQTQLKEKHYDSILLKLS